MRRLMVSAVEGLHRPQRNAFKTGRAAAVLMATVLSVCAGRAGAGSYLIPQDAFVSARAMETIAADITGGRPSDAVERIEGLFNDPTAPYVKLDDGRVISIQSWVESQLIDNVFPLRFREQYEKVAGQIAQTQLVDAAHAGDVTAMLAVAERYPWTMAAQQAPIDAALRLLALGDGRGARDLIARVSPDRVPASLRQIASVQSDSTLPHAAFSAGFLRAKAPPAANIAPAATVARLVPVASAETVYLAAPTAMMAVSRQGRMLWSIIDPQPEMPPPPKDQPKSMQVINATDGSLSRAAVWCDLSGMPRVIVARQSTPLASSLRAVRPADGSIIWTTAGSSEQGSGLLFAGTPTISGRYVYSLALAIDPARGHRLCLVALELASGKVLFKTELGDAERVLAQQVRHVGQAPPTQMVIGEFIFTDSSTLTADDRNVYVVPGGGGVWCVDRFSGAIRWIGTYTALKPLSAQQERERARDRERERQDRVRKKLPPQEETPVVRWQNAALVSGKAVVAAPVDATAAFALNIANGKTLWTADDHRDAELVAVRGARAVFASGSRIFALQADTGAPAWEAPLPAAPRGPAFVDGDSVGVVTEQTISFVSLDDGKPQRREPAVMVFDPLLRQANTRTILQTAGLMTYFGEPPPPPSPEKTEKPTKPEKPEKKKK